MIETVLIVRHAVRTRVAPCAADFHLHYPHSGHGSRSESRSTPPACALVPHILRVDLCALAELTVLTPLQ